MIEIVFEGYQTLNESQMHHIAGGDPGGGCACCICDIKVQGGGDITAKVAKGIEI